MSKKIMFNDKYGLTQAVLEGRKTQTRRLIGSGKIYDSLHDEIYNGDLSEPYKELLIKKFSKYNINEVVAIAQRYKDIAEYLPQDPFGLDTTSGTDIFSYNHFDRSSGYRNKMFVKSELMPHHIKITNIRVEKLQDISDKDCLDEGIIKSETGMCYFQDFRNNGIWNGFDTPRESYAALIDKVSGKGTWDNNPYVFVYDFELVD